MHINIGSLSKHIDEFKTVLSMSKVKFDVVGITESKQQIGKVFIVNVDINGYHMYKQPFESASRGVVIYVNDELNHSRLEEFPVTENDFEFLWIEISNQKKKNIICGCIYRHPNKDPTKFLKYIESTISKIDCYKYEIFLIGDFNIDLLQYDSNTISNDFINSMTAHSFLLYILQPTRITDHSATVIDNIFSNITDSESISGNLTTLISDHFIQFMFIKNINPNINFVIIMCMIILTLKRRNFFMIFLIDWSPLTDSPELVNNNFDYFCSKITSCVESHVPKKRVARRGLKLRSKPWIGSKIQKLMYLRGKIFKKANKSPTSSNKYLYHKFRICVVAEQRQSKI